MSGDDVWVCGHCGKRGIGMMGDGCIDNPDPAKHTRCVLCPHASRERKLEQITEFEKEIDLARHRIGELKRELGIAPTIILCPGCLKEIGRL